MEYIEYDLLHLLLEEKQGELEKEEKKTKETLDKLGFLNQRKGLVIAQQILKKFYLKSQESTD